MLLTSHSLNCTKNKSTIVPDSAPDSCTAAAATAAKSNKKCVFIFQSPLTNERKRKNAKTFQAATSRWMIYSDLLADRPGV